MRIAAWILAGLIVGGGVAVAVAVAAAWLFSISQAEGAYAMSVAFFWVPLGAALGAGAAGIYAAMRRL